MARKHLKTTLITEAVELFLLDGRSRRLTKPTLDFYTARLKKFTTWFPTNYLHEIDSATVKRFLVYCQDQGYSDQYQHGLARAIKTFLTFCYRDKLISVPVAVSMPKLEKKVLPALSSAEIKKILAECQKERDTAIVYTLLDTGVRAAELCALTIGDLDSGSGTLVVQLGKGQKGRIVPIGAKAIRAIKRYLLTRDSVGVGEPLFLSNKGGHLRVDGLVQVMDRLSERSGVENCTAHAFRRTFAITCLRNGMNVHILARCMGHSDIQILRQYLDIVEADLHSAHAKVSPADNL